MTLGEALVAVTKDQRTILKAQKAALLRLLGAASGEPEPTAAEIIAE